jgi:conjugative transfer region protein TrbK
MKVRNTAAAIVILSLTGSVCALAQSVDDLLKDHTLLRSELERCSQMGMASNDDARCKTARTAEQKRFFGSGVGYTQQPTQVTPGEPVPPITNDQKAAKP